MPPMMWLILVLGLLVGLVLILRFLLGDLDGDRSSALGVERDAPMFDEPVHQLRFPTEWEAKAAVARLEHEGIRAVASGGMASGYRAEAPGYVGVLIPEAEKERAEALLAEPDDIDWESVDVGAREDEPDEDPPRCPHCGYDLRGRPMARACPECGGRLDQ